MISRFDPVAALALLAQEQAGEGVGAAGAGAEGGPPPPDPGGFFNPTFLLVLGAMFLVFYFLMIRPEGRRQRAREAMLKAVKKGDTVVTTAGILGKVHRVEDKEVVLQVDKDSNTRIRFLKSAINEVLTGDRRVEAEKKETTTAG